MFGLTLSKFERKAMEFGISFYPHGLKAQFGQGGAGRAGAASEIQDGLARSQIEMFEKTVKNLARRFPVGRAFDLVLQALGLL